MVFNIPSILVPLSSLFSSEPEPVKTTLYFCDASRHSGGFQPIECYLYLSYISPDYKVVSRFHIKFTNPANNHVIKIWYQSNASTPGNTYYPYKILDMTQSHYPVMNPQRDVILNHDNTLVDGVSYILGKNVPIGIYYMGECSKREHKSDPRKYSYTQMDASD